MLPQKLLNSVIQNQLRGMYYQLAFSASLLVCGLVVVAVGLGVQAEGDVLKQMLTMGGTFITSLTALPFKEVLNRKERVSTLREMLLMRPRLAPVEQARLDEIAWKTVEKIVAG